MVFDGKRADFAILYKAAMYSHPIQTKSNGIIFVVEILVREVLIFSKWNPRYHGNG